MLEGIGGTGSNTGAGGRTGSGRSIAAGAVTGGGGAGGAGSGPAAKRLGSRAGSGARGAGGGARVPSGMTRSLLRRGASTSARAARLGLRRSAQGRLGRGRHGADGGRGRLDGERRALGGLLLAGENLQACEIEADEIAMAGVSGDARGRRQDAGGQNRKGGEEAVAAAAGAKPRARQPGHAFDRRRIRFIAAVGSTRYIDAHRSTPVCAPHRATACEVPVCFYWRLWRQEDVCSQAEERRGLTGAPASG